MAKKKLWQDNVMNCQCFLSENKIAYVEICIGDNKLKRVPVRSKEFRDWIRFEAYKESDIVGNDMLNSLIDTIEAQVRYKGETIKTFKRVGQHKGEIYYDLNNCNYIKVSKKGYEIVENAPICFIRNDTMLDQVVPKDNEVYDLWDLRAFINVKTDDEFILLLIVIITYFIPEIPHYILVFIGNQGSSKSTVSRIIKKIVDPSFVDIYSFPNNKGDLVLHLNNAYLVPYDNLNTIKREFNDVLCQVATGGNFLKRTLYTDSELSVYTLQGTIILNSIAMATNQPDLLDRSTVINLKTITGTERKTEKEIFDELEKRIPHFLHHIFTVVSKAISLYKTIELEELPRMADAALWACAIAEALGVGKEKYMELYKDNQRNINSEILADNAVAYALLKFMKNKSKWKGAVNDLWQQLEWIADNQGLNKYDSSWAKSPSYLSRYLNVLRVNLEREGIKFIIKNVGPYKEILLKKESETKGKEKFQTPAKSDESAKTTRETEADKGE